MFSEDFSTFNVAQLTGNHQRREAQYIGLVYLFCYLRYGSLRLMFEDSMRLDKKKNK